MNRKDGEKDSDRPHYYSQFWLDVAAGRRVIGAPRSNDEADIIEPEILEPELMIARQPEHSTFVDSDGYQETLAHPEVEPLDEEEEFIEAEPEEFDMIAEVDDTDIPNIAVEDIDIPNIVVEDTDIPDMDLTPLAEEEEDLYEEEEEEEEDADWPAGRGRKKPKPGRPVKQPLKQPPKRTKRDTRRPY